MIDTPAPEAGPERMTGADSARGLSVLVVLVLVVLACLAIRRVATWCRLGALCALPAPLAARVPDAATVVSRPNAGRARTRSSRR